MTTSDAGLLLVLSLPFLLAAALGCVVMLRN
jgi:hypothetical protein